MRPNLEFMEMRQVFSRLYARLLEPVRRQYGLTQMELDILLFLRNNPEYDTAAAIVSHRMQTKSQVSLSVEHLTQRGWLERVPDVANQRIQHLRILPPAEQAVQQGQAAQRRFGHQILDGITPEERQTLATLLRKLTDNARSNCGGKD